MKMLIDLHMDGYDLKEDHKQACIKFIKDQFDSTSVSVKIIEVYETS